MDVQQEPVRSGSFIKWPDLTFPPINLWSAPYQWIKYKTDEYKTDDKKMSKEMQAKRREDLYRMRKNY